MKHHPQKDFTLFARKVLTATTIASALVVLVLVVYYTMDILLILFAGILAAAALDGLGAGLTAITGIPRRWSLCLGLPAAAGLLALIGWLLFPSILDQVHELQVQLPIAFQDAVRRLEHIVQLKNILRKVPGPEELLFGTAGAGVFTQIAGIFSGTFSVIANIVIVVFIGLYLTVDPDLYVSGILRLIPAARRARAREILEELGLTLRWWLIGTLLDMALIGLLTGVGLWLLGINLALTLGIATALLTFIPFIGPAIAVILALLVALVQGPAKMLWVLVLYIAVQLIDANISGPLIQQRTVLLPPVLTLVIQIVFGSYFGFLGLALATPFAAAGLVLIRTVYIEDVLGGSGPEP